MRIVSAILQIIMGVLFCGFIAFSIWGAVQIVIDFGTGSLPLIAPTIFLLIIGVNGLIDIYRYIKKTNIYNTQREKHGQEHVQDKKI